MPLFGNLISNEILTQIRRYITPTPCHGCVFTEQNTDQKANPEYIHTNLLLSPTNVEIPIQAGSFSWENGDCDSRKHSGTPSVQSLNINNGKKKKVRQDRKDGCTFLPANTRSWVTCRIFEQLLAEHCYAAKCKYCISQPARRHAWCLSASLKKTVLR